MYLFLLQIIHIVLISNGGLPVFENAKINAIVVCAFVLCTLQTYQVKGSFNINIKRQLILLGGTFIRLNKSIPALKT